MSSGVEPVTVDLTPGSAAFDQISWAEPDGTRTYLDSLLGSDRSKVGMILPGSPVVAGLVDPSPGRTIASVTPGLIVFAPEGSEVRWPGPPAVVESVTSEGLTLSLVDQDSAIAFRGLAVEKADGTSVGTGEALGPVVARSADRPWGSHVEIVPVSNGSDDFALVTPEDFAARRSLAKAMFAALQLGGLQDSFRSQEIVQLRDKRLARSQRAYYFSPPAFVRGRGVWMYDEYGNTYLDTINNVTHVGHSNPRITRAATRQLAKLNTNSRFVYRGLADYADRLVSTLPDPLEVVFFVCTGSEANDLALRISRQVTGRQDVVILDGAYHGNTTAVMEISPNRYKGPGGRGKPETTHELEIPNRYRGSYGYDDPDAGSKYASDAEAVFQRLHEIGSDPAAFIAESLMGTAGNVVLPEGYLEGVFASARRHGALCISDEVQVGAARLGSHFWGFQDQGVVPDIVTMGKPIGNGHPMAAVVTTREIAQEFDDGVKYFNTFAGNPVSCAIGMEVLQIIEDEGLQENAQKVGQYLLSALSGLMDRHPLVGDVRGKGLYIGVELILDRASRAPAKEETYAISDALLGRGVISYPTGQFDNVLKIKPPMVFDKSHADFFVEALDAVLTTREESSTLT